MNKKVAYIAFFGKIRLSHVGMLMTLVQKNIQKEVERIVIVLSSKGGDVFPGMLIYDFLKSIPAEVVTHGLGQVESSAVPLFCAGSTRICDLNTSFMFHDPALTVSAGHEFNEKSLQEQIESLRRDRKDMLRAIADSCGKKIEDVEQEIGTGKSWNSEQAKDYGLVHEIKPAPLDKVAETELIISPN